LVFIMCSLSAIIQFASCITPQQGSKKVYSDVLTHKKKFDAIIVPGIAIKDGQWNSTMKARVIWSWILYSAGVTKNVIYSGGAVYSPYKEAVIMGLYAQKLGIPKEHIFYDTAARHG